MTKLSEERPEAQSRAWYPGTSHWDRLLPYLSSITLGPGGNAFFAPMMDFVIAARSEPTLAARHVFPSTINMTIFETADSIPYDESALHARVIVSPAGSQLLRVRCFPAQKEKPEKEWVTSPPPNPGGITVHTCNYVRRSPVPTVDWVGETQAGIEIIRKFFASQKPPEMGS
jgi:hypothetical protein